MAWGQTDVLNRALTEVTGTSYSNWSGKTSNSDAVYAGNSAGGNNAIQMRSSDNSGIVTTASGGKVTKVSVTWNSNTANGRTLNIYGKNNTAYSSASDLYNASARGTLLGTIVYGTSTELTISGDYAYIGMRSNSGAMYLDEIEIMWLPSSSSTVTWNVNGNVSNTITTFLEDEDVPSNPTIDCSGKRFIGWTTSPIIGEQTTAPSPLYSRSDLVETVVADDITYYAVFADGALTNTILWSETWTGGTTEIPSAYEFEGTTVYGGSTLTYTQSISNTKLYNENRAGGTAPELLLAKSNGTWTISNIPTGGATRMSLTFLSNKTNFSLTSETSGISISGSGKSWTITASSDVTNFNLILKNTGSDNARIDNIELKVTNPASTIHYATSCSTYNYTVSYNANGGTGTMTDGNSPYGSGATVTVLANTFTAPAGMDFNGWNTSADGSGTYYDAGDRFSITENTTLYAQWVTSGCRSVAFSSMELSNGESIDGIPINISPAISVTFNTALGSYDPAYYTSGTSIRAYAKNTFTISTSGSNITSILLTFGSGEGSNDITASTGTYSDGMWVGSASSVTFTVGGETGHRRIASIRACTGGVTLLYDANGGAGTMIDTNNPYTSGSTVTTMTNDFTAPTDMEFGGWNTAVDGSGDYYAEGETFTITASTTLYAQWVAPSDAGCPEITFSEQGYEDATVVQSVSFGSSPVITATFSQGTNGSNAPKYYNNGTAIRAYNGNTITVSVAGFNVITSIRLIFGDGGNNNTITSDVGTYNSGVWSGSETSVTFTIGGANGHRRIAGIRVCTAQPTSATVTYDGNGASGEVTDNNSYDINATVTVLGQGNLENPCNTFAGWNTAADGSGISYQEDSTFTITENVTLYAQWTPTHDYTITWLANGHFIDSHNFGCGSNINVANVPENTRVNSVMCDGSMIFVGWSETEFEETNTPSATIITREDFSDITVNGNKTYYAVFADGEGSSVIYSFEGGTVSSLEATGVTTNNLSDYAAANAPYQIKFDNTGDYMIIPCGSTPVSLTFGAKMIGGPTSSTFTIQASTDGGSNFSDVQSFATSGAQNTVLSFTTTSPFPSGTNQVKIYFTKGSNVGVGPISIIGGGYSAYTTFCPCAFDTDGIEGDNNFIWTGKNVGDDWGLTSNWVVYNSSEPEYHLAANEPTNSTKVFIINSTDCNIVTPTVAEDATCGNLTINGFNIDIAENQTLTINGTATFTNGIINGKVTFGSNATISGVSRSSHVDGIVTKSGAANSTGFYFPTGSNGNLGKVVVTDGSATNVSVQYFSNPAGFGTNDLPRWWNAADMSGENPFNHVSNVEYWRISSTEAITANFVAEASTDMHFNSETADEDKIPTNIQMAFYDNNRWTNVGGSASIDGNTLSITGAEIPASATRGISGNYTTFGSKSKSTVLPIELVSFTANCNGKSSLIEWTTATEKNNDFFVLERSHDAVNFKEIARVAGAGNSIEPIDYAYIDYGARSGDNYYRLVQVDYDGTSTTSEIIVANCLGTNGEPEVLAYPNPFGDDLTLRFENFGNIQAIVEVYDMLGRMVHTQKINCSQNDYEVVLRLAGLSDGTYNVRISTADFVINRKVVKE